MKTRITDIFSKAVLFTAAIAFLSSCSRQVTQIGTTSKMQYAQVISKSNGNVVDQKTAVNQTSVNQTTVNQTAVNDQPVATVSKTETKNQLAQDNSVRDKTIIKRHKTAKSLIALSAPIVNQVKQKIASASVTIKKSNVMSHSSTSLEGNLRIAVICFIVALICSILAYIFSPFWIVAAIFWVVGIVFLLLWLINMV
jgi:hypothetical protein